AIWVLGRWARASLARERWARAATEMTDAAWWPPDEASRKSRRPRLLLHDTLRLPCAWGVWRPTILLPRDVAAWPEEERRMVLRHELSHLQRRDPLWQLV